MRFKLVEPLRQLFKDEVRARRHASSGSTTSSSWRQPFPGPGLAVRILGEVTRDRGWTCCARPTRSSPRK